MVKEVSNKQTKTHRFITPLVVVFNRRSRHFVNSYIKGLNLVVVTSLMISDLELYKGSTLVDIWEDENYRYFEILLSSEVDYTLGCFLEGKYSNFLEAHKKMICNHFKDNNKEYQKYYGALYKTEERRKLIEDFLEVVLDEDAELFSILNIDEEVMDD